MISFDLPVCQSLVLPTHRGELPNPEHTGALDILHRQMVENDSSLTPHVMRVKRIRHDQEDVNVPGVRFGRDEGAEHGKPYNLPSADSQRIDAFQALSDKASLQRSSAKVLKHFSQRRTINPYRQITMPVECRPFLHRDCLPCSQVYIGVEGLENREA